MSGISVISVKNHFFILLNKFNLHTIIYDYLSFRLLSLFSSHLSGHMYISVPFKYLIRGIFHPIFLNFHFNISTYSKCKGFYNFQAIKLKFFCMFHKVWLTKRPIQFLYLATFEIKKYPYSREKKFRKLSFERILFRTYF